MICFRRNNVGNRKIVEGITIRGAGYGVVLDMGHHWNTPSVQIFTTFCIGQQYIEKLSETDCATKTEVHKMTIVVRDKVRKDIDHW